MFYLTSKRGLGNGKSIFDEFFAPVSCTSGVRADVIEKDNEYEFRLEIPGYKKDEIHIWFEDKYLVVEAKKAQKVDEENITYLYREISAGEVKRGFYLENADEENIMANYIDGILSVIVTKKVPNARRIIEIE